MRLAHSRNYLLANCVPSFMSRRTLLIVAAVLVCGVLLLLLVWDSRGGTRSPLAEGETATVPLADYGRLSLDVAAGGVDVFPGTSGMVRITATRAGSEARIWQRVGGSRAEVRLDNLGTNPRISVEVPRHTDLDITLRAGELKVHQVAGHKKLDVRAGRIQVENARSEYGHVRAFVLSGRIAAPVFSADTGGIWRSRSWKGAGDSYLNATVLAGEVDLREAPRPQLLDLQPER